MGLAVLGMDGSLHLRINSVGLRCFQLTKGADVEASLKPADVGSTGRGAISGSASCKAIVGSTTLIFTARGLFTSACSSGSGGTLSGCSAKEGFARVLSISLGGVLPFHCRAARGAQGSAPVVIVSGVISLSTLTPPPTLRVLAAFISSHNATQHSRCFRRATVYRRPTLRGTAPAVVGTASGAKGGFVLHLGVKAGVSTRVVKGVIASKRGVPISAAFGGPYRAMTALPSAITRAAHRCRSG